MTSASIPRVNAVPATLLDLDREVSQKAATRLGYNAMLHEVSGTEAERGLYALLRTRVRRGLGRADVQGMRSILVALVLGLVIALLVVGTKTGVMWVNYGRED